MIKTIVLNGPPGSGKDESARILLNSIKVNHLEFKSGLRIWARAISGLPLDEWVKLETRELKEVPTSKLLVYGEPVSPRQFYQWVSEVVVKPILGEDYFGNHAASQLIDGVNVFTDGGFYGEVEPVKNKSDKFALVRLERDGCTFEGDTRSYLDNPTHTIINNGTKHDLHAALIDVIRGMV